jgi:hypothetical protein
MRRVRFPEAALGFLLFQLVGETKYLWCSTTVWLLSINADMNACGALVQS